MQAPSIDKELAFFIYLLEVYAAKIDKTANETLALWSERGAVDFIEDSYEMYHQESIANA
ncbi:MAG: DUF3791 domain-containing protein, partial [Coriobacteriales bacterium]|nr:DUF3791 domain-containing protein [Coriobacteriales bacterium]